MCNLQEHSDRSAREHAAQQQEPIYTELAAEYGIDYQPLATENEKSPARSFLDQTVYISNDDFADLADFRETMMARLRRLSAMGVLS